MYRKGDDWSERIASGVAGRLGLPAARTELAVDGVGDGRRFGVISKSVLALPEAETGKAELVDGNQLLWLSRCKDVDGLVEPIRMIPAGRMSVSAREFAERVLRRNCYRLLN